MTKIIQLLTDGKVEFKEREFTRLMGGFESGEECMSDLQIAQLLNYKMGARFVRQHIERNSAYFEKGLHYDNLSERVAESNTLKETLISLGYSKQSLTQAKNIYVFSKAGMLLYLKFAEGDKAIEIYKEFIEDYFRTKAENKVMKKSIEEQIEYWTEQKALAFGKAILGTTELDRFNALTEVKTIDERLNGLQDTLNTEKTLELVKPQLDAAELLTNAKYSYDVNTLSKALDIEGLGRNNLFKWMREKEILRKNNEPHQQYMKYFKVIYTTSEYGHQSSKTLIRPVGVGYLIKRLKKDGKVVTKSVKDILSELEGEVA